MELFLLKSPLLLFFLQLLLPLLSAFADPSCNNTERDLIYKAFGSVSNFQISQLLTSSCNSATEIRLPARNLTGTVSWTPLRQISSLRALDLSDNFLQGSIPGGFWSAPALVEVNLSSNKLGGTVGFDPAGTRSSPLQKLDLSRNRFTNLVRLFGFPGLRELNLSRNDLRAMPLGIERLTDLERLDISRCNISGEVKSLSGLRSLNHLDISRNFLKGFFPRDFPQLSGLKFLDISNNNFTGTVVPEQLKKFGDSAFVRAGTLVIIRPPHKNTTNPATSPSSPQKHGGEEKRRRKSLSRAAVLGLSVSAGLSILAIAIVAICVHRNRRIRRGKIEEKDKWNCFMMTPRTWKDRSSGPVSLEAEAWEAAPPWVAEARAAAQAPVVMFEKPLLQLTFSDLAAATSGFGKESQLAEGRRSGPVYRAVLMGEMDVAVKLLETARETDAAEAAAAFQDLGSLKHPNLLPLLGYCIAGKEKLLVYEYMENGDLHRWLHELPAGRPNVEDWSTDTWEHGGSGNRGGGYPAAAVSDAARAAIGWPTRHRIALGIARGLAFLHHAGSRPVVHGHLVPSNVLLSDDFEPRIADFGTGGGDGGGTEADVYSYGVVLMELLTGTVGSEATVSWVRGLVRARSAARALDPRLSQLGGDGASVEEERQMTEALRVGYLCTAESPDKRPTMKQVVDLLKDIRPV